MQALPYIILGIALTLGVTLIIVGCVTAKNAFALLELIPACVISFSYISYINKEDDSDDDVITKDFLIWLLTIAVVSIIALPCVLYHLEKIGKTVSLILDIIGCVAIFAGCIVVACLDREDDFTKI
ncbi:vacuolar protein sorting 55, putative [Trichomonas vaginalis G3]|uniref:Vacuolar protein sorting 55, putative n=1 Tax=Trichomonas vaginalis (strain ATCC PRA-98 / G3) TaxID=412133 RepID=A2DQ96_TRIV3|nr:vacuolar protein sorting 55 family [Trichomonas vaginalis G3]EAY17353.1 vacuolar protein sorting 55, putative [Trichomonas vaginalis G3]KAI5491361.1 vacuolar protein sorting 55 family [Trichomonas vaginalis G3]|eukprot:XP_001330722.1 vacuolar protein sorting 55 [Trichomonas vaginalis G3]